MKADIIAEDRDEKPFLFAEVKIRPAAPEDLEALNARLRSAEPSFGYAMLVDPYSIVVVKRDGAHPESVTLKTADVLSHYSPNFRNNVPNRGSGGIFHDYLSILSDVWLHDFAFHWKSESPPGAEEFARIGLVERLKDGVTRMSEPT